MGFDTFDCRPKLHAVFCTTDTANMCNLVTKNVKAELERIYSLTVVYLNDKIVNKFVILAR